MKRADLHLTPEPLQKLDMCFRVQTAAFRFRNNLFCVNVSKPFISLRVPLSPQIPSAYLGVYDKMAAVGNERSITGLRSSSCTAAIMRVFQAAPTPVFVQAGLYTQDPWPVAEALMEAYDNKGSVIYGLL
ncbi:hypothetical protein NDU88_010640 [Pleurodeles waltl]|uniref:Uncharacterized protein n=1 Tax=Pleurodeles waltl TaxID=8319 RepID=A0AAV7QYT5_PLEWA|nr:hypothetical protein NDU88_010640 [Pleurodeles waltl]